MKELFCSLQNIINNTAPGYILQFGCYFNDSVFVNKDVYYIVLTNKLLDIDQDTRADFIGKWDHVPISTEILNAFSKWLQDKRQLIERVQQEVADIALNTIQE